MIWSKEEKHDIFRHEEDFPELAKLLRAKNKFEFEQEEVVKKW